VNSTLSLLEGVVQKSKKDMFEIQVNFDQNSFVKLFTLTYYRNTLSHIFFQEAVVATALASFGHQRIVGKSISVQ
jgi:glycerol-3-phosphate O-acyltransferase